MNKKNNLTTKLALIDLYTTLIQYSLDINDIKKQDNNKEYLSEMNELDLIKYIKDSMDTVILTLAEKKINEFNKQITCENIQQDYESMLIKYEQDIRGHIKIEHQLKLYSDSLQNSLEELEKEKKSGFNNNNNEIENLKKEINNQKKVIKSYEEQNTKLKENEKKLKNVIVKNEKKYKNDIEILNKKLRYYIEKIQIIYNNDKNGKIPQKKIETIFCNSSRICGNKKNIIKNLVDNGGSEFNNQKMNNSLHGVGRIYRNSGNSISVSDNHSTSMANSRPYVNIEKYLLNKYIKNTSKREPYQYQNKIKNLKNLKNVSSMKSNNIHNCINIPNNNSNNSYILDSKAQDEIVNRFMMNNDSYNKKFYNRHKSVENNSNIIKAKNINIKKILMQQNNNNRSIINRKISNNASSNSINSERNYMNQTAKEININNIIENKNNIGCNFVNNINIYSNYLKQDNYVGNNLKKFGGNTQYKGGIKNNNSNKNNNSISYRNKLKEGKVVSSLTNNLQKKF